jgi:hypothetical protein
MKKTILMASALFVIFLSSCSTMVRVATTTHNQVMDSYTSKEQVIGKFGMATSKRTDGDYEEWNYLFGVKTVTDKNASLNGIFGSSKTSKSSSSANATGFGGMASGNSSGTSTSNSSGGVNANASARVVSQEIKTFVKFTFKGDKVVTWESNGVDYGVYQMVSSKKPKVIEKSKPSKKSKKKK